VSYVDEAAFYRAALLLGLIRGPQVIAWADEVLGKDAAPPAPFTEIATTDPDELTQLRHHLFELSGEGQSGDVVRRLLGLVHADLSSGRRTFTDTLTVLRQLRGFLKLDRDLNEHMKALAVDVGLGRDGAEARVRDWLQSFA